MPLNASKYAPRTPAQSIAISRAERLNQDKQRATRLLSRLHWKAESLMSSYNRAVGLLQAELHPQEFHATYGNAPYPFIQGMGAKQAESMFKVDFFEFYTLLERFLTLCLSVLGISISGVAPRTNVNALRLITNPQAARANQASHQFHANLLDALDDPGNPLHTALGHQDIRIQLGLAKDYRNRWKDADETTSRSQWGPAEDHRKPIKIDELGLTQMIHTILAGCVEAIHIINNHPSTSAKRDTKTSNYEPIVYSGYETMDMEDTPLEYMDDMDLD